MWIHFQEFSHDFTIFFVALNSNIWIHDYELIYDFILMNSLAMAWIHMNSCEFMWILVYDFTIFFMIMIHEFIYEFATWIHDPEGLLGAKGRDKGRLGLLKMPHIPFQFCCKNLLCAYATRFLRREQIGMCIKIYATPLEGCCGLPTGCSRPLAAADTGLWLLNQYQVDIPEDHHDQRATPSHWTVTQSHCDSLDSDLERHCARDGLRLRPAEARHVQCRI